MRITLLSLFFLVLGTMGYSQTPDEILLTWIDTAQKVERQNQIGPGAEPQFFRDLSPAQMELRYSYWKNMSRRIDSLAQHLTTEQGQLNYEIYRYILDDRLAHYRFKYYLVPLNAEGGFLTSLSYLPNYTRLHDKAELENYHRKLDALVAYLGQQQFWLEQGMKQGITLPQVLLPNVLGVLESLLADRVEESVLFQPVQESAGYMTAEDWRSEAVRQKVSEVKVLLKERVQPALQDFHTFLQAEYGPRCRTSLGMAQLPQGKAMYQERIRHFTTLPMTPEEVAQKGREEVARIRSAMQSIIDELNFTGDFADFFTFLRTDPQFYAATPEALLREAAWISKRIEAKLPAYFGKLPRQPFTVAPVPDAIAPTYTGGRYVPGNFADGYPGTYWVNTYNLASRPLYVLPSLSLHEAVPGHHLQMALSKELTDLPYFRQRLYISAFGEGWALYTENLGKEMGIYETAYEDFGRLTYEMWRACRLVVDVGIHYEGWTREQAVDFMSANAALSMHEVNTEIDRYIGWPGQAVSYKIGELYIRDLRQRMEDKMGADFDIRDFHDRLLSEGTVPLPLLEKVLGL